MSQPDEPPPDWSLLPHDAAGFFGLFDPIDRKDLKRAYNKLLRRFKPEKAPEEFQWIRAAYESLDERLRYGDASAATPQAPINWNAAANNNQPPATAAPEGSPPSGDAPQYEIIHQPPDTPAEKTPSEVLDERLDRDSPQELYAELAAAPEKSPYEYYALAVMSDVVDRGKPLRFAEWLLSGLTKHPDSGPLWRLLHDYLRGPLPDGAEETLLPALARVAGDDSFYPLTEPLWLALLRAPTGGDPVERVARLLQQCERELRDERIAGRMAFYIQLAKASLLASDHPWPGEALDFLESNFEHAPPWLEADLDMLGVMRDYRAVRQRFAAKHPLCRRLDAALRDYFLQDQQEGDRAVVAAQVAITEDLDALMAAFPLSDNDLHEHFFPLWRWVSWDVGERNAPPPKEESGPRPDWQNRVYQLIKQLDLSTNGSWDWWKFAFNTLLYRVAQLTCFLLAIGVIELVLALTLGSMSNGINDLAVILMVTLPFAAGGYLGYKLNKKLKDRIWDPYCVRNSLKLYYNHWRHAVVQLQERSHLDDREFRACFAANETGEVHYSGQISMYVQQDYAPAVLSTAQRFLA